MTLGKKLVTAFLGCGLIPLGIVAYVGYSTANSGMETINRRGEQGLEEAAYNQLVALRDVKKAQIQTYFDERQGDMGVLTANVAALRQEAFSKLAAVQELKRAQVEEFFAKVRTDVLTLAQSQDARDAFKELQAYRDDLQTAPTDPYDVSTEKYDQMWREHHRFLGQYVESHGYYDTFLISADHGHVMYTAAKESDIGQNLAHGDLKNEGLAQVWRKVCETKDVAYADFEPYSPSNGQQAAFVGAPFYGGSGDLFGVVVLQIPTDPINAIVQKRDGMGRTGETYLVGHRDGRTSFRSDMLTMGDGKYVIGYDIHTAYIDRVIESKEGFQQTYVDSKGNPVLVAADPLNVDGLHWACISKIDFEEAIALRVEGEKEDFFTKYNNLYGYYDLFLINQDGYCFYSVCQEADYQTNLVNGKYASSNLGELTRTVLQTKQFGFADFAPYEPSAGAPAAFIAQPVIHDGKTEIVVALQLPIDAINRIMGIRVGMGETGETYLIGPDKLMRSDSYLDQVNHTVTASFANPGKGAVDTEAASAALKGDSDAKIIIDYNGNPVLSAYTPLDVFGTRWALLAEIDESEALAAARDMRVTSATAEATLLTWIVGLAAGVGVVVALVSFVISRSISRPIKRIVQGMTEGSALVAEASNQVNASATSLAESSSEQASSLEETSSSLEEMSAMTRTNASNAEEAAGLVTEANDDARQSETEMVRLNEAMTAINESSGQISKIIKVIEEIAFQTNLLALNAAVEAARAGEHGKGFAVVADEVRNLAMRAAEAARETTGLIEASVTRAREGTDVASGFGQALTAIVGNVTKVADLVGNINQASGQQAQGVDQINSAVAQMDQVTQAMAANAEESASAVEELSAQADAVANTARELAGVVGMETDDVSSENVSATIEANINQRRQQIRGGRKNAAPGSKVPSSTAVAEPQDEFIPLDGKDDNLNDF